MSGHTPGPWTLHQPGSMRACDGRHDTEDGCRTLVEAEIIGVPRPEAEANAKLIAAAPELLQLLKEVVLTTLPPTSSWVERAHEAIAKAEGRS
jgi:hypothetical protein